MFWVISVYFNIRNALPKSGTFLLGHPVYVYMVIIRHIQGTAVPLQAWTGPEGSRRLRLPDFKRIA